MPSGADEDSRRGADDEVRLGVPADPEFLRLARITASGLASRAGFSLDEVEDLRLALDELCFWLVGAEGRPGNISLRYGSSPAGLVIEGTGHFEAPAPVLALGKLSELMLDALVDEHQLSSNGGAPRFRLLKRRGSA